METIIFGKTGAFGVVYYESRRLQYLATFIRELDYSEKHDDVKFLIEGLTNKTLDGHMTYYTHMYVEDETVNIYTDYKGSLTPGLDEIDQFKMSTKKFIELLLKFKEVLHKKPSFIILKIFGDEFSIEEDYHQVRTLEKSKITINEKSIENNFGTKIQKGLINEGFHIINKKQNNIILFNKMVDCKDTVSVNISIDSDFTFNRAMFQDIYTKEDVVKAVIAQEGAAPYSIIYDDNHKKIFHTLAVAQKTSENKLANIRVLCNEKSEIIAIYPIFRRIV